MDSPKILRVSLVSEFESTTNTPLLVSELIQVAKLSWSEISKSSFEYFEKLELDESGKYGGSR